ncbi:MAG: M23 family metallopeptidase [Myxococcota bacterium]
MNARIRLALVLLLTGVLPLLARDDRETPGLPPFSVAVEPESVPQGGILRVVVRPLGRVALLEMTASLSRRSVTGVGWTRGELHALLPVAIDEKKGPAQARLRVKDGTGAWHTVEVPFTVRSGEFDTDELGVSRKFTSPTSKQQAQAREDARQFQALWDAGPSERRWRGSFLPPVPTEVTARYGTYRTINGKAKSRHMGLDLGGRRGDPVFAANDGKVVMARNCFYSGNTVVLDHGMQIHTLYFHLTNIHVKVGQVLKRGALLGTVGATGRVTGPHLHFGVKMNRLYVDPMALLQLDLMEDPRRPPPGTPTENVRHIPERAGEPGRSRGE